MMMMRLLVVLGTAGFAKRRAVAPALLRLLFFVAADGRSVPVEDSGGNAADGGPAAGGG